MQYRLAFSTIAVLLFSGAASSAPSATLDAGTVIGTTTAIPSSSTTVNKFLGIPFAAPPERFSPPQKPKPWSGPLNATAIKPACVQQIPYPEAQHNLTEFVFNNPPAEESEDCLYINVWAPSTPVSGKGRAVMIWIYGGGLTFGHGGHPGYDGTRFAAEEDVVVVTFNYRTNVFGFPTTPDLPIKSHNLGFLDQRLGLDWVQRNIHAFGGDPSKVTIFGESAGAFSIDILLTSYPSNSTPPFRAAILQSGQVSYGNPYAADTTASWDALAAALNCTDVQSNFTCIRDAPADTIKSIIEKQALYFNPVRDNVTWFENYARARIEGKIAKIPVLSGTDAQESRVLTIGQTNATAYLNSVGIPADLIPTIEAAYPVGGWEFPTAYDSIAQMATDLAFHCGDALWANATAASGIPSWRYYFNATFPNTQFVPDVGVYHSSELWLTFGTYAPNNITAQEVALSSFMRGAWAKFAKDPVAGPGWNAIGTGSEFYEGAGDLDIGLLGSEGSSGVKIIRQQGVDSRCEIWTPILTAGI